MTETPQQAPPPAQDPVPPQGWNTENLKDYRLLRRSRGDRKVAGVAGGLGRHLDVDPTVLRVLLFVLVFFGGAGLLLYGALWLLVPEEGAEAAVVRTNDSTRNALLIAVAVVAALAALGDVWNGYGFPWQIAVIGLVVAVVLLARDRSQAAAAGAGPSATGPSTQQGTGTSTATSQTPGDTGLLPAQPPQGPAWHPPAPPRPARPSRRNGPLLWPITLALAALVLGVLGLYDAADNPVDDAAYPALALAVIGAMLVLGAFFGRAGGLIAFGVVASLTLGGAALGGPSYEGERDLVVRPTGTADLEDFYAVPAGRLELDLTEMDAEELEGRSLALDVNVGEVVVVVPDGVDVTFDARVHYGGAIESPEGDRDGWAPHLVGELEATAGSRGTLELDIDLQMGHIELRQS